MNPTMKQRFYGKGNRKQAIYISRVAGMNTKEKKMFWLWHKGLSDEEMEEKLLLNADTRKQMECRVAEKVTAALLHCIDTAMQHDPYFGDDAIFADLDCFPEHIE